MAIVLLGSGNDGGHDAAPSTSRVLTLPVGTAAGDVFVVSFAHQSTSSSVAVTAPGVGTTIVVVAPTGAVSNSIAMSVHLWVAPVSPPSSVTFTLGESCEGSMSWRRFSGVDATTALDVVDTGGWINSTTYTCPSITTTIDGAYVLGGTDLASSSRGFTTPAGWVQDGVAPDRIGYTAHKGTQATAGATGTVTFTQDGAATRSNPYQLALKPAAASAVTITPNGLTGAVSVTSPALSVAGALSPNNLTSASVAGTPALAHIPAPVLVYRILGVNPTAPATSLRFSVKTTGAASVRVKIGTDAGVTAGVSYSAPVAPDGSGWSQHVITGLASDVAHWYLTEMTDAGAGPTVWDSTATATKTLPSAGTIRIAHGSCLETGSTNGSAFTRIAAQAPDLFLHLGDWNYADSTSTSQATHLANNEAPLANNPALRALVASVPTLYIVSDHDAGPNGALPGAWTAPALAAYRQFWPSTSQGAGSVFDSMALLGGKVRALWTDDRRERTSTAYLPAAQVTWMQGLLAGVEPVKLWVQSGPWNGPNGTTDTPTTTPAAGGDKWWNYGPSNSDQHGTVASWIAANAVGRVVTLHGDSHSLCADDGTNAPGGIGVIGAAPFDKGTSIKGGPYSHGTYTATLGSIQRFYGITDITDAGSSVTVAYSGFDSADVARITMTDVTSTATSLVPGSVTAASSITTPALTQVHTLTPSGLVAYGSVTSPIIAQVHTLTPASVTADATITSPTMSLAGTIQPDSLVKASSVAAAVLTQLHRFAPTSLVVASSLTSPTLRDPAVAAITPPERTLTVPADDRVLVVAADPRTLVITLNDRTTEATP